MGIFLLCTLLVEGIHLPGATTTPVSNNQPQLTRPLELWVPRMLNQQVEKTEQKRRNQGDHVGKLKTGSSNNFGPRCVIMWKRFMRQNKWKLFHFHLSKLFPLVKSNLFMLWMRKLRLREIWSFVQGHTVNKWIYPFAVLKSTSHFILYLIYSAFVSKFISLLDCSNLNYQLKKDPCNNQDWPGFHSQTLCFWPEEIT